MDNTRDTNRTQLDKIDSAAYKALTELSATVGKAAEAADIQLGLVELIRLRVSQINHCAFCVRTHARDALAAGETTDRIAVLSQWRETAYFSERERAALELAEAVTAVNHAPIPDDVYALVAQTLSEQEISAVSWITIVMNSFNRVWVTSSRPVLPA